MNIAVCEDLQKDADELCTLIRQYCLENQLTAGISFFSSGEALLEKYEPEKYQILFLDILMDGTDGMETARKIRQIDNGVTIIFVTVSKEFAVESYMVDAAFYIVKPLDYGSLCLAMERCRNLLQQYAKSISVAESRHMVTVRLRDILYLESQRNDCVLYTCNGEIRTRAKLSELEVELGGWPFLRCHRSFIVNLNWLENMLDKDFVLRSGAKIPISRAYGTEAQREFRQYLISTAQQKPGTSELFLI